jgi:hypothetical protein
MTLSDPEQIVGAVADVLGIPDQITAEMRAVLVDYLTDGGAVSSINLSSGQGDVKLRGVFALLLQSPAYQLH